MNTRIVAWYAREDVVFHEPQKQKKNGSTLLLHAYVRHTYYIHRISMHTTSFTVKMSGKQLAAPSKPCIFTIFSRISIHTTSSRKKTPTSPHSCLFDLYVVTFLQCRPERAHRTSQNYVGTTGAPHCVALTCHFGSARCAT